MKRDVSNLKSKLFRGISWNLVGSIIYEASKLTHQVLLFTNLGLEKYGLVGSTFSFMYLTLHVASFESGPSILPFHDEICKNKKTFFRFLTSYMLINAALLLIGSLLALYAYSHLIFSATYLPASVIVGIILSEGLRIFMRLLLHSLFINRPTMAIDLLATFGYFAAVWIPYLYSGSALSMYNLFVPYLVSSLFATLIFMSLLFKFYLTLPFGDNLIHVSSNLVQRIIKARLLNYATHLSKHFFTGNFLTPFFAVKFGLGYAGILKFASYIADSIKALLHVSVGYTGSAMLALLKGRTLSIKRKAFSALWKTFNIIIYPLIIFICFNFSSMYLMWTSTQALTGSTVLMFTQPAFIISLVLLFISITENFFLIYEDFYLIEEEIGRLLGVKIFEYLLFFSLISFATISPVFVLVNAIVVRVIGFIVLAAYAYTRWGIKPHFAVPGWYLVAIIIISGTSSFLLR